MLHAVTSWGHSPTDVSAGMLSHRRDNSIRMTTDIWLGERTGKRICQSCVREEDESCMCGGIILTSSMLRGEVYSDPELSLFCERGTRTVGSFFESSLWRAGSVRKIQQEFWGLIRSALGCGASNVPTQHSKWHLFLTSWPVLCFTTGIRFPRALFGDFCLSLQGVQSLRSDCSHAVALGSHPEPNYDVLLVA